MEIMETASLIFMAIALFIYPIATIFISVLILGNLFFLIYNYYDKRKKIKKPHKYYRYKDFSRLKKDGTYKRALK